MADKDARERRLAEAMRANLRRRKAQARDRAGPAGADAGATREPPAAPVDGDAGDRSE